MQLRLGKIQPESQATTVGSASARPQRSLSPNYHLAKNFLRRRTGDAASLARRLYGAYR